MRKSNAVRIGRLKRSRHLPIHSSLQLPDATEAGFFQAHPSVTVSENPNDPQFDNIFYRSFAGINLQMPDVFIKDPVAVRYAVAMKKTVEDALKVEQIDVVQEAGEPAN
jgi:hypothetical protein